MSIDNSHQISDVKVMISQGADGVGIDTIEKTSSQGIEDTYTITLTDGRKTTFTVTNGNGIDHIAKTGTQGLVDEYTIYFDDNSTYVYYVTNGQGGGMSAELLITSDAGSTITVTNPSGQTIPVSQVTGSTTEWTCSDTQYGLYIVESDLDGDTVTVNVTVDNCKIYSVSALHDPVPDGSTVTPTDDIQIWLHCAEIFDKDYTTLADVLADTDTLVALMANDNACDYLVRSTTWESDIVADSGAMLAIGASDYCSDTLLGDSTWANAIIDSAYADSVIVKVPTMTSNTTPSGECSASTTFQTYYPYYAFNGNTSTSAVCSGYQDQWIAYTFTMPVKVFKATTYNNRAFHISVDYYDNDNSTWIQATTFDSAENVTSAVNFANTNMKSNKWRLLCTGLITGSNFQSEIIQFYGRVDGGVQTWLHEADITDKDYTTLAEVLADSTTLSALMASQDAVDYLVTCKGWADTICADQTAMSYIGLNNYCANTLLADSTWLNAICNSTYMESVLNVKVPEMTSNTTPSGVASASDYASGYEAYHAFGSGMWIGSATATTVTNKYVRYAFPTAKKIFYAYVKFNDYAISSLSYKIQGINGSSSVDLCGNQSAKEVRIVLSQNIDYYSAYQLFINSSVLTSSTGNPRVLSVQFYGREDV